MFLEKNPQFTRHFLVELMGFSRSELKTHMLAIINGRSVNQFLKYTQYGERLI